MQIWQTHFSLIEGISEEDEEEEADSIADVEPRL